jgi:hypothetical protein
MVSKSDYNEQMVQAAYSVLLEVNRVLGEYRNGIAIIGGWVPDLILPLATEKHVGSTDVDLALDHTLLQNPGYETIKKLLTDHDYETDPKRPFVFFRKVVVGGQEIAVEVDLLAGEYEGTGKGHRHQRVQDVQARKARGCDLVFDLNTEVTIEGTLPDGKKDTAKVRVANAVSFLVTKGMAMAGRLDEKDPYDVYYCVNNYPGGIVAMAEAFRPHLSNKLVIEGLRNIAAKFQSVEHVGPVSVADFEEVTDPEDRARIQRDAYERVQALLSQLAISTSPGAQG